MKILKIGVLVGIMGFFLGCRSSHGTDRQVEANKVLDEMIAAKTFEILAEWAQPLGTQTITSPAIRALLPPGSAVNRINLMGTTYYLRMKGDSVSASLPYYGERQVGGTYGRATGIEFEGLPRDLEIVKNEKKQSYLVSFTINDKTESYQVNAQLFPSMTSFVVINSSQRFVIRYEGRINELREDSLQ